MANNQITRVTAKGGAWHNNVAPHVRPADHNTSHPNWVGGSIGFRTFRNARQPTTKG